MVSRRLTSPGARPPECRKDASAPSPAKVPPLFAPDLAGTKDTILFKAARSLSGLLLLGSFIVIWIFSFFQEPVSLREEAEAPSLLGEPFQKEYGGTSLGVHCLRFQALSARGLRRGRERAIRTELGVWMPNRVAPGIAPSPGLPS